MSASSMSAVSRSGMPSEEPGPVMEKIAPMRYGSCAGAEAGHQDSASSERAKDVITRMVSFLLFAERSAS